jgi:hypothetical protein
MYRRCSPNKQRVSDLSRRFCARVRLRLLSRVVWSVLGVAVLVQIAVYEWKLYGGGVRSARYALREFEKDLLSRRLPLFVNGTGTWSVSYARVRDAVLRVSGTERRVFVLCRSLDACRSSSTADEDALLLNERTLLRVRAAYRSAYISVHFVVNETEKRAFEAECQRTDGGWEHRTTLYQPLTPFVMKNLAHWTFDLVYPLYVTMRLLSRNPLDWVRQRVYPPRLIFDTTSLGRAGRSALRLPPDGRRLLHRLGGISTSLTPNLEFRSMGRALESTFCFRDLVLGAREQNLRHSNWNLLELSRSMDAQRGKLLRAFSAFMRNDADRECSSKSVDRKRVITPSHDLFGERPQRDQNRHTIWILGRGSVRRQLRNGTALVRRIPHAQYVEAFGNLPWCLQYTIIRDASGIVAMHGAEWSYLLLVRKPSRLRSVELFPPCAAPLTFYASIARYLGVMHHMKLQTSNRTSMEFDVRYPQQRTCLDAYRNHTSVRGTLPGRCCLDANIVLSEYDQERIVRFLAED